MSLFKCISRYTILVSFMVMCLFLSGCWNYKEVNQFATVAGIAIDRKGSYYLITVEIYNTKSSQGQLELKPVIYSSKGKTIFEGIRNLIMKTGRKLYWSHAKSVIISKDIARKGVLPVIDWLSRDAEIRSDMWTFISKEKTAKEIFKGKVELNDILSYQLNQTMRGEKVLSKSPAIDLWKFTSTLSAKGSGAIMPTISLSNSGGEKVPDVSGTAVFSGDKVVGFIGGTETMDLLFVKDEIKGGVIPFKIGKKDNVTLEIFGSKTSIRPTYRNGILTMHINIKTKVNIAEIQGATNYTSESGMEKVKKYTQKEMEKRIYRFVKKIQNKYGSDILGYNDIALHDQTHLWKTTCNKWPKCFKKIETKVHVKFDIIGSAKTSQPLKVSH